MATLSMLGESMPTSAAPPIELEADGDALQQLFLNLFLNAAQALPLGVGGSARVTTERLPNAVEVRIADSGAGMDEHQLAHLDMPYRSSKRNGTGIGLKIARGIVANHRGTMTLDSVVGVGTAVRVVLPRVGA